MKRSTTWTVVGGLWGGGIGLIFGPIPAVSMAYFVLQEMLDLNSDGTSFAFLWGAFFLLIVLLGAMTGYLLGRDTPQEP